MKWIEEPMLKRIEARLAELEQDPDVHLVYVCESGSRAWGFPSKDSDYDVRFLYLRPLSWYLSVFPRRDVIEEEIDRDLDLGGWDVRKALALLRRGNAPLLEWLASPVVYYQRDEVICHLRQLARQWLPAESLSHHYLAQSRRLMKGLDEGSTAKLKTYLYAMRCLAAARWIVDKSEAPPMAFDQLLDGLDHDGWDATFIADLLREKQDCEEKDRVERRLDLEAGLRQRHDRLVGRIPKNPPAPDGDLFDGVFRRMLVSAGLGAGDLVEGLDHG